MKKKKFLHINSSQVYLILRILLGMVFVWASYSKILNPEDFAHIIKNYRILPSFLINPVAVLLPWTEALCGLLLITGCFTKGAALIVNILIIIFISAIIFNLYRGIDISCGCFSLSMEATKGMYSYLIRDLLFLYIGIRIFIYTLKADNLKAN